jgi:pentatricopeptide repeat protein
LIISVDHQRGSCACSVLCCAVLCCAVLCGVRPPHGWRLRCAWPARAEQGYAAALLGTLERLREDDSIPKTKPLFLALMRSTGRARQPTLLFRVFEELKAERIEPDTGVYTTLLNAARLWSVQREHAELLPDACLPAHCLFNSTPCWRRCCVLP